ncbi:MAG: DUF2807 domain-containing protein, partial [Undibacterium sp.]|nr:DUF2807 domain-containing protein [Undibacterium sp.]
MIKPSGQVSVSFAALFAALIVLGGCEVSVNQHELKGSGKTATEVRTVSAFDSVSNVTPFNVVVTAEGTSRVEITGDDNLLAEVETIVEGNTLLLRNKRKGGLRFSWNHAPVTIKITAPAINKISNSGSGDMRLSQLHGDKLLLTLDGSGDIQASGTVGEAKVKAHGSGNLDLAQLHATTFTLEQNGSGNVHVNGITQSLEANINGSGDLEADGLQLDRATLNVKGSGSATLNGVIKSLTAELSGSGDLFVDRLQADQANFTLNSSGEIRLAGEVRQLVVTANGSGDLDASTLQVGSAVIKNFGSANMSFKTISNSLKAE